MQHQSPQSLMRDPLLLGAAVAAGVIVVGVAAGGTVAGAAAGAGPSLLGVVAVAGATVVGAAAAHLIDLNGERMQSGSTGRMIFDLAQLVAYVSHFMMLEPGDIITTGTPPGVGMGQNPQTYLKGGETIELPGPDGGRSNDVRDYLKFNQIETVGSSATIPAAP